MGDSDQVLLNHYNLTTLYPAEWPASKDDDDGSDDDILKQNDQLKPKFTTLERGPSLRSNVPGSQRSKDGVETLVQKDESDPLGGTNSVVQRLRQRGLPVEENLKLRNRFLLSSTTFSPSLYLSEVHNTASTEELLQGLDFLSQSIEKKSASLKVLVESNFERFVRAKATIDNVYSEMRNHGADPEPDRLVKPERPLQSRRVSNRGRSFRKSSGLLSPSSPTNKTFADEKRKNALTKESEYGVQGIRLPLVDATAKAEEIWGPALGGREREQSLRSVLMSIEKNRMIFEVGASVDECIKRRDYETLATEYARAHKFAMEIKVIADRVKSNDLQFTEAQLQQIMITARVWMDIQNRVDDLKREIWKKLTTANAVGVPVTPDKEAHFELIAVLLQLGVEENPIWAWLLSQHEQIREKINDTFERARIELEIARRRLAHGKKPSGNILASYLRTAVNCGRRDNHDELDEDHIVQFWKKVCTSLNSLLSTQNGMLGEVIDFWEVVHSFNDGKRQRTLPTGIDGRSRKHHRLDSQGVRELQVRTLELFVLIQQQVHALLVQAPLEDISTLLTPVSPTTDNPGSAAISPSTASRFNLKLEDIPAPSPKTGESWENFAFWAPHSNSLSAGAFLNKIVTIIATGAGDIAAVELVSHSAQARSQLRDLVSDVRERSITAICAAWLSDSDNCRELEDWTRSTEKKDLTNLPAYFSSFESTMLLNLQKIAYISDVAGTAGAGDVIAAPSHRHIETIQKAFKSSLYKAFSGMMEHAAKPVQSNGALGEDDGLTVPLKRGADVDARGDAIDATNINVRKLLTMSNLQALRSDIVPKLVSQFESNFSLTITDDAKAYREVLGQMNARVFQAYVRPTTEHLRTLITAGIITPTYAAANPSATPSDARPYVYDILLSLVLVHTEVSSSAPTLTNQILSYLLEQISTSLLNAFKQRQRYTLSALMQATLDVEFTAQTLNNYTTDKASEVQGQIYLALDERTDNEARLKLQTELPQMRSILKRLREGTKVEFACFKRERRRDKEGGKDRGKEKIEKA